jgi:hypothetical protein
MKNKLTVQKTIQEYPSKHMIIEEEKNEQDDSGSAVNSKNAKVADADDKNRLFILSGHKGDVPDERGSLRRRA